MVVRRGCALLFSAALALSQRECGIECIAVSWKFGQGIPVQLYSGPTGGAAASSSSSSSSSAIP